MGSHISNHPLQALESGQGFTELYAFFHVSNCLIQRTLRNAERLGSNTDTAAVKGGHSNLEAAILLAEQTVCGQMNILKDQLAGLGAADAHFMLDLTNGKARIIDVHDESRNALVAELLVGHGKNDVGFCAACASDKDLGTVDDVRAVLLLLSDGLLGSGVSAGVGLGQTESAHFLAGNERAEPLFLLLGGAILEDGPSAQGRVRGQDAPGGAAETGCLFNRNRIADGIAAGAAELLGELDTQQAVLLELVHQVPRILLGSVSVCCNGLDLVHREFTAELLHHCLFFCQPKIHAIKPPKKMNCQMLVNTGKKPAS